MTEPRRRIRALDTADTSGARFDPDAKTPETEGELHAFVKDAYGVDMPRVAVCPGHVAPMTALWKIYSRSGRAFLILANRFGGKTHLAALLHLLFARFIPGHESIQLGSIEKQAMRASDLTEKLLMAESGKAAAKHPLVASIKRKVTQFLNGSKFEIAAMTPNAVNGPHPAFVAIDELEFLPSENAAAWEESRSMSAGTPDAAALDLVTSTRKWRGSRMDKLVTEQEQAVARGEEPAFEVLTWCYKETAANVPNCGNGCGCAEVVSGTRADGSPRTFADECNGDLKRAGGYVPLAEIQSKFKQLSRSTWESQMSCQQPSKDRMVLPEFSLERHTLAGWTPHPGAGPIIFGVDWGSTNPTACLWAQLVTRPNVYFRDVEIPQGAIVVFDEIYKANKSGAEIAEMAHAREENWRANVEGFYVTARVHDVQGRQVATDFIRRFQWSPAWSWQPKRDTAREARLIAELTERDRLRIDTARVRFLQDEALQWQYPEKRFGLADVPVDDFDHSLSALRFIVAHVVGIQRNGGYGGMSTSGGGGGKPPPFNPNDRPAAGPPAYRPLNKGSRPGMPEPMTDPGTEASMRADYNAAFRGLDGRLGNEGYR